MSWKPTEEKKIAFGKRWYQRDATCGFVVGCVYMVDFGLTFWLCVASHTQNIAVFSGASYFACSAPSLALR